MGDKWVGRDQPEQVIKSSSFMREKKVDFSYFPQERVGLEDCVCRG